MTHKNTVITDATAGIGLVIADHLIQSGYSLIVLSRSDKKHSALFNHLKRTNPNCDVKKQRNVHINWRKPKNFGRLLKNILRTNLECSKD